MSRKFGIISVGSLNPLMHKHNCRQTACMGKVFGRKSSWSNKIWINANKNNEKYIELIAPTQSPHYKLIFSPLFLKWEFIKIIIIFFSNVIRLCLSYLVRRQSG